jgi:hypothetical protein
VNAIIEAALFWDRRGVVPVRVIGKVPVGGNEWQKLRPTPGDIARWRDCNLGLLLGSASGGLVDVDLDCIEAIQLADFYLPSTWTYGRASKPRSHRLFVCHGARTIQVRGMDDKMALELRADTSTGEPGAQSVVPPSVHVSGEPIEWSDDAEGTEGPLEISLYDLQVAFAKVARGVLFMQAGATVDEARAKVAAYRKPAPPKKVVASRPYVCGDVIERARKYLARMDASVSGSFGHRALFMAAVAMVRGFELDHPTALDLLRSDFNPRCSPPWNDRDLERKIDQAADKASVPFGYLLDGERQRA